MFDTAMQFQKKPNKPFLEYSSEKFAPGRESYFIDTELLKNKSSL